QVTPDSYTQALLQKLSGYCTRGNPHGRFPGGRPAATPIIPNAIFVGVGVVRVCRAKLFRNLGVILGALIRILNDQANRCTGGFALEHTRQNAHFISFTTLSRVPGGAGFPTVQIGLHISLGQLQPRRTAVNDAAQSRAVAFTKGGYGKQLSESISRHISALY